MPRKAKFKPVTMREFDRVLDRYVKARIDLSWMGSKMPKDDEIKMEMIEAQVKMNNIIERLKQAKMEE